MEKSINYYLIGVMNRREKENGLEERQLCIYGVTSSTLFLFNTNHQKYLQLGGHYSTLHI